MLSNLWIQLVGDKISMAELTFLGGVITALINWIKTKKEGTKWATIATILESAIHNVSLDSKIPLDKENTLDTKQAEDAMGQAIGYAKSIAYSQGVDITKTLGGDSGLRGAIQGAFKRIKGELKTGSET